MYNNDVGKESAQKFMKQTSDLYIIDCLRQVVAFAPKVINAP
jgi:hypothetical protein